MEDGVWQNLSTYGVWQNLSGKQYVGSNNIICFNEKMGFTLSSWSGSNKEAVPPN
jgi:hypothetical protein